VLKRDLPKIEADVDAGAIVTITDAGIRCRPLPLE
jgi:hypothetical protein